VIIAELQLHHSLLLTNTNIFVVFKHLVFQQIKTVWLNCRIQTPGFPADKDCMAEYFGAKNN